MPLIWRLIGVRKWLLDNVGSLRANGEPRVVKLTDMIKRYIDQKCRLLGSDDELHNKSSDIIESVFGLYKGKYLVDKMHGITSLALAILLFSYKAKANQPAWNGINLLHSSIPTQRLMMYERGRKTIPHSIRQQKLAS